MFEFVVIARALADWFVELPLQGAPPAPGSSRPAPDPPGSLRVAAGWPRGAYRLATTWPEGGLGVASGPARDAIPPVPPKTVKRGPQPPKSAIESHLRFTE